MVRIGGLASGMDIDQLVGDLMKAERIPLDKLKQNKQILEWQRDDFRSINTLLLDFRSQLTQMKLSSNYRVRQAASTNDTKVSVSATSAANLSSFTISNVTQLASAETRVNEGKIYNTSFDPSQSLYAQNTNFTNPATNIWRSGALKSISYNLTETTGTDKTIDVGVSQANMIADERTNWSVKVNGIGFKAVVASEITDANGVQRALKQDEVLITDAGKLQFGKEIAQGSTIKVDYIANDMTESLSLSKNTSSWQLSQGAINSISSFKLVTTTKVTSGNTTTEQKEETAYTVEGTDIKQSGVTVGSIDMTTGKITFLENKLPKPDDNTPNISYKLEATYSHKFTNFTMSSHTSNGTRYDQFLVSGSESLNNVMSKVNSASVGATMFYDTFTGQMTLTRSETGDYNDAGAELNTYGSLINDVLRFRNHTIKVDGKNAILEINGLTTERTSNTFQMNGVTFTLKKEFTDSVSTSISNNAEKVVENIKNFVNKYNEMIETMRKKISEERYGSYLPLTDQQREQLSDKQQESWEEKAKSGLLKRDPIISTAINAMRLDFYQPVINDSVQTPFNQLAKIGIKTTSNYLEGGKLELNEAQLRQAIESDPESVEKLFTGTGTTESQKGLVHRLYDTVLATMDKLKVKAGNSFSTNQQFTIGKLLDNMNKSIDRFEEKLTRTEDRYWRQFTAMEKTIQKSNEQMSYLMQQFGGGA
ncbi:flagellar filament capping protein FliD [Peribacillus glennii]|uniref:Flagellar hook-associated protein 2 n=1 Tax=Peribacillus glennii TaxID=2303991 RepID=A0A372LDC1_9BACI|nr:flagellar filament capping protein FliD [Peribacillus glennii]RFU63941.1 flagellar hook protein [Peribacillus glennii]